MLSYFKVIEYPIQFFTTIWLLLLIMACLDLYDNIKKIKEIDNDLKNI